MSRLLLILGKKCAEHPLRTLALWALLGVLAVTLNGSVGGSPNDEFELPGAESQVALDMLKKRFPGAPVQTSSQLVFHATEGLDSDQARTALTRTLDAVAEADGVSSVSDPLGPGVPTVSDDGTTAYATVLFEDEVISTAVYQAVDGATAAARDAGLQVEYAGALGYAGPAPAEPNSEVIGVVAAVVVLAVAFGSLVALTLPIVTTLVAILIGTCVLGVMAGYIAMPEIATVVGLMIGLGVGIDYALLVLARHRQHLAEGMTVAEAVGRANATAGQSVLFAGTTVIVAIAGLQVSGIPMLGRMGWGSAIMVLVTMTAAITLLPGLLGLAGHRVNRLRLPFVRSRVVDPTAALSVRWARFVVRRPAPSAVVAAVLLAVLALPVLSLRLGFPDAGNDSPASTTRKAYDLLAEGFGPGFNGSLQVVVDVADLDDPSMGLEQLRRGLASDPGIASVGEATFNPAGDFAVLPATPSTAPQDNDTAELIERLRDDVLPPLEATVGAEAFVTGESAILTDVSLRLQERMPWFLGVVIGLSFIVLTLVFRSILVPLKAAVLNVLSIGASYGVLVAVFQWGWGASLIGVESTVPIMPLAPMLMFAILFGLSMDYEVFLLSRVREQYLRHGRARDAVVEGVGASTRVITSAALIMICVFSAFVLAPDVTTKLFGVGLATAVLLDVTLVRMVLVPAAMTLLGERAWWLPRWLDSRLPHRDLDGRHAQGEDEQLLSTSPRRAATTAR